MLLAWSNTQWQMPLTRQWEKPMGWSILKT